MRFLTCPLAFLLLSWLTTLSGGDETAARPIERADSVLAIYPEDLGRAPRDPALILAIWPDGQIVWSKDRLKGGAPYYAGRIAKESEGRRRRAR